MLDRTRLVAPATQNPMNPGRMRWMLICPPLFFFWGVANIDKVGISVIAANNAFLQEMGLVGKAAEIGMLMTAFTLMYGLSSIMWGYVVDRIGPRKTVLIGIVLWAISLTIGALAHDYTQIVLSRLVLGLGEGMIFPVTNKYINDWFHPKEMGKAQASWVYGTYLGPALGLPLLVWIVTSYSWNMAFVVLAIVALIVNFPMMYLMTKDSPRRHPAVSESEQRYIEQGKAEHAKTAINAKFYTDFRYWLVCIAFVMVAALFYGITFWMPTYLQKAQGMSASEIKASLSLSWIFAVFAVMANGIIADRTKRPALVGLIVFLICGIALIAIPMQTHPGVVVALLAIALGCTASQLLLTQLILVKLAVPKNTGKAAGVMGLLNILGGFVTALMGFIVDQTGGNYNAAFLLLVLFPFVGVCAYAGIVRSEKAEWRADPLATIRSSASVKV
jgi:ACS family glucarate transporter-like MFS transporter